MGCQDKNKPNSFVIGLFSLADSPSPRVLHPDRYTRSRTMGRDNGGMFWRATVRTLATLGLLFLLVTFSPFVSWYATKLARPWSSYRGDVLVVLSASGPSVGIMDASTYWRCFMAVLYYREHPYTQIIVSGRDSARGMRDFLVFNGIPGDRIRVEDKSVNTHEKPSSPLACSPALLDTSYS